MKVYPGASDPKGTRKLAKQVGLNKIKTKDVYRLFKTGAKNSSPFGYPDEMFCEQGNVSVASQEEHIWIIITNDAGRWFKTSPIISCEKTTEGFKIETLNSFYELKN